LSSCFLDAFRLENSSPVAQHYVTHLLVRATNQNEPKLKSQKEIEEKDDGQYCKTKESKRQRRRASSPSAARILTTPAAA